MLKGKDGTVGVHECKSEEKTKKINKNVHLFEPANVFQIS